MHPWVVLDPWYITNPILRVLTLTSPVARETEVHLSLAQSQAWGQIKGRCEQEAQSGLKSES